MWLLGLQSLDQLAVQVALEPFRPILWKIIYWLNNFLDA